MILLASKYKKFINLLIKTLRGKIFYTGTVQQILCQGVATVMRYCATGNHGCRAGKDTKTVHYGLIAHHVGAAMIQPGNSGLPPKSKDRSLSARQEHAAGEAL